MSRIIHLLVGLVLFLTIEQNCYALSWNDLWYNSNQQAAKLLKQHPESAAKLFSDSRWQGVAYFNSHDYQAAAGAFATDKTSDGFYNQGNALAYQNNYPEAIKAYQEALKLNPQNQDAQYNLDLIKKLQQQQSPQDQKNPQSSQKQQNSQSSADSKNKNSAGNNSDNNSSPGKSAENKAGQPPQNLANQAAKNNSTGTQKSAGQSGTQPGNNSSTNQGTKEPAQSQPASQSGSNGAAPLNNNTASKSQTNPNNSATAADSHLGNAQPSTQPNSQQLQAAGSKSNNNPANSGGVVATAGNSTQKMTPEDREVAAVLSQIPDDPGGLLRNKFLRDYQNQSAQSSNNGQ